MNDVTKKRRKWLFVLIATMLIVLLTGCGETKETTTEGSFSYSDGIDEKGFWQGVTALDYVELYDYDSFAIPSDIHTISDEAVQSEIDTILAAYSTSEEITDREVEDGDTVNIDYVGSVDGVEFDGGSTDGAGSEVTIGETSFIDDFLEQLIGHSPGETFDINVTFPEDYGEDNLNGKDAVFVTTVNSIVQTITPELTDTFVADDLSSEYGWTTIAEMKAGLYADLQKEAIQSYIQDYITNDVEVESVPDMILQYEENAMTSYYQDSADSYSMELEEFLSSYVGVSSLEELIESNSESNLQSAKYSLVLQAIAEDANITVSTEDIGNYFKEAMDTEDYSEYEESYGLPYLMQITLDNSVMSYLEEHAVLE
jgi:trigger factor